MVPTTTVVQPPPLKPSAPITNKPPLPPPPPVRGDNVDISRPPRHGDRLVSDVPAFEDVSGVCNNGGAVKHHCH